MTIATFLFFTALVAALTWWITRNSDSTTNDGYFLAGRSLTGVFIAGSLLLTNLSTEQLVGLNGGAFKEGLSVMCWEVLAGISLVALALFFLPKYLKSGIATIPQFLENRYGSAVRSVTAGIFIVAYMLILLPFVLYLGARGLNGMLELDVLLGLRENGQVLFAGAAKEVELQTIWIVISFIALVGSAYAIWGGLKAVAVSDTLNGAGLLVGGLLVTYYALSYAAGEDGSLLGVLSEIQQSDSDAFRSLGSPDEDTYWPTLFTGVLLLNFFYWCTNQQIIQRTFGAKNLAEGQKGVLTAAFFKILAPLILVLPGIVAAYLVIHRKDAAMLELVTQNSKGEWADDKAYGALVHTVLPTWLIGFFAAVIVGSILSTFNSVLNSSATLFSLDVYKKYIRPDANSQQVVRSGQICSLVVAVFAVIAAPTLFFGRDSIFDYFQKLNGVYFIPLLAVFLFGVFNRKASEVSALISLFAGLILMVSGTFFFPEFVKRLFLSEFHFMGVVFLFLLLLQFSLQLIGFCRSEPYVQADVQAVDLTPWKPARIVGGALVTFALGVYIYFL